jgi:exodeoxyribonuclease-5
MQWNSQQEPALKAANTWFYRDSKKQQIFRVFGFAGTGKTTLARHFAENIDGDVCYASFTGKAALVMRKNGCVGAKTIHSLIYKPVVNDQGQVSFKLNKKESPVNDCALIIIDECSMVDEELAKDLLSFKKPILVLGDPAQLPPVKGAGYFTECKPDIMLTEIHRQAADNPIIYLANEVRNGRMPDIGQYGGSRVVDKVSSEEVLSADQVIVGRNATRERLNSKMRKMKGIDSDLPIKGDKLICCRNDSTLGIFNGGMFTVEAILDKKFKTNFIHMSVNSDDFDSIPPLVKVHKSLFDYEIPKPDWKMLKGSQEFDFGYAITCHRTQGSQWKNVLIYDESWCFRDDWNRWLYTAITRAEEDIVLYKV